MDDEAESGRSSVSTQRAEIRAGARTAARSGLDELWISQRSHRTSGPTLWSHVTSGIAAYFGERLIGRPQRGAVTITFPNGKSRTFGRPGTGEHPKLIVHNFSMIPETLRRGTVGFANAYMRGDVEVDDLTALFRYFLQNRNEFQPKGAGLVRPRHAGHRLPSEPRQHDRRQQGKHLRALRPRQ